MKDRSRVVVCAACCVLMMIGACARNVPPEFDPATHVFLPATAPAASALDSVPSAHPSAATPLTPDGQFPRFSPAWIVKNAYPDHMHDLLRFGWPTPVDADGRSYGPGSICERRELLAADGLDAAPGRLARGPFVLEFHPEYRPCDIGLFLELCEFARQRVRTLLGIAAADTLRMVSCDNFPDYQARTGNGSWRLFHLDGNLALLEPVPVLTARMLVAHAAVDLVTLHALRATADLPPWLEYGLAAYIADYGIHFMNFMAYERQYGEVLMSPAMVDSILSSPPVANPEADRPLYRKARYNAFLMAWRLVEEGGGLSAMRAMLDRAAADGAEAACREIYGRDPSALADDLDPLVLGEPVGTQYVPINPARPMPENAEYVAPESERNAAQP